jgi:hypothetical protein
LHGVPSTGGNKDVPKTGAFSGSSQIKVKYRNIRQPKEGKLLLVSQQRITEQLNVRQ